MNSRILITGLTLIGVITALLLPGATLATVAASPAINSEAYHESGIDQHLADWAGEIIKSITVTLFDESYHVDLHEIDVGNRVKAVITLPNGKQISYGSVWKGFTPDQVMANAIGRKDPVAQAVALAAGAVPPVNPVQIVQSGAPITKLADNNIKPLDKPKIPPVTPRSDDGNQSDGGASGVSDGGTTGTSSSAVIVGGSAPGAGGSTVGAGGTAAAAGGATGISGATVGSSGGIAASSGSGSSSSGSGSGGDSGGNSGPGSSSSGSGSGGDSGSNSGSGSSSSGSGSGGDSGSNSGSGSSSSGSGSGGDSGSNSGSGSSSSGSGSGSSK